MSLDDLFETEFATRKTVWSKRGDTITRREVDTCEPTDVPSRNRIEVKHQDSKR